jgi:hypothetical protein
MVAEILAQCNLARWKSLSICDRMLGIDEKFNYEKEFPKIIVG